MKKILSLFLALLLILSGCAQPAEPQMPVTEAPVIDGAPQILVPDLTGKYIYYIAESENYQVVQSENVLSDQPAGTVLSQSPEAGTFADLGCTILVVVSAGDGTTQPQPTDPQSPTSAQPYWPERTEPDLPEQEDQLPEVTEAPATQTPTEPPQTDPPEPSLDKNGSYTSKDDVALYIHLYGRLPNNFITKNQADDRYGTTNVSKYGYCIGGDRFYNKEGRLPSGYTYYECDIGTLYSSSRGTKRLVFTYSGIIYYTSDHYETFTRLY